MTTDEKPRASRRSFLRIALASGVAAVPAVTYLASSVSGKVTPGSEIPGSRIIRPNYGGCVDVHCYCTNHFNACWPLSCRVDCFDNHDNTFCWSRCSAWGGCPAGCGVP